MVFFQESKDAINESSIVVVNFTEEAKADRRLIKWDPPDDPNGLIVAYEIEYTRETSSNKVRFCFFEEFFCLIFCALFKDN